MMNSLRNFLTGPRLIAVVLVCALPFVFLGTSSLSTVFTGSFGTINGEEVTEADLNMATNTAISRLKSIYGEDFEFDVLDEETKGALIKQELISQKVLLSQARSLGFINDTSIEEAKKSIIQTPQFQIEGVFNEDVYEAQVNSNGYTKDGYVDLITDMYASEVFRNSIVTENFVTQKEIYKLVSLLEQTSDIKFTKISFDGLKNEIINTVEELTDYYNNNSIKFYSEEKRNFSYLILDQTDYESKVNVPEDYIKNSYEEYLIRYEESAQIRIAHIMIEKNNYESRDIAYDAINNVNSLLLTGEDFSKLASQYSEDIVTKEDGGDLEYFQQDVFPIEFEDAIENLALNETSKIIELDDTFHILKITEINVQEAPPEEQVKDQLKNELIQTESFALMQDDFNDLEEMIYNNASLAEIAIDLSKNIETSSYYSVNDFNFSIDDPQIKDYLFSLETVTNEVYTIELGDVILLMSINTIVSPSLKPYDDVKDEVENSLTETKALEKIALMDIELNSIENESDKLDFINSYEYLSNDNFVNVKRYSSLLPREVLTNIFNEVSGEIISVNANNGDKYTINIKSFKKPSEEEINEILDQYQTFADENISNHISNIINEDIFQQAKVKLDNLLL
ncbi:MAG: peptidylprolyl isomerase [Gammaproteobacteria bacterium]|nr:peptidylprolyl isomerase [Gammaproteobacteria bacterium]